MYLETSFNSMSESVNPIQYEMKSNHIFDLLESMDRNIDISKVNDQKAAKLQALTMRMKEDNDKKELLIIFNGLMMALALVCMIHFIMFGGVISLIILGIAIGYFIMVKKRLTEFTVALIKYKNDALQYLWQGFHLKEMRMSAVKLAFLVFFPLFTIFVTDIIVGTNIFQENLIRSLFIAYTISTLTWFYFFADDGRNLASLENELKVLEYL